MNNYNKTPHVPAYHNFRCIQWSKWGKMGNRFFYLAMRKMNANSFTKTAEPSKSPVQWSPYVTFLGDRIINETFFGV